MCSNSNQNKKEKLQILKIVSSKNRVTYKIEYQNSIELHQFLLSMSVKTYCAVLGEISKSQCLYLWHQDCIAHTAGIDFDTKNRVFFWLGST